MNGNSERLNERVTALHRAMLELTVVVETISEMVSASNLAAARDLLTPDEMDDVGTKLTTHLIGIRDALQQAGRA